MVTMTLMEENQFMICQEVEILPKGKRIESFNLRIMLPMPFITSDLYLDILQKASWYDLFSYLRILCFRTYYLINYAETQTLIV